jgi:hypothetical protein
MAVEFLCFVGAALVVLIPGIWLAGAFSIGENLLERSSCGCALGLALAVYLASAISYFDLRMFYPMWGIVALGCAIARAMHRSPGCTFGAAGIWLTLILVLVAASRFAMALPRALPPGALDPTFQLILARQIQLTHHAINRWPFANIPLNYPTGSSVLLVVLSGISRLPLHRVFLYLIPLLGVLTTAQMFMFARRMTGNSVAGIYAAAIYGLWAWFGSIDYFRWGGLPNELAMLLFLTMLSLTATSRGSIIAMSILFSGVILVHHHVMVVSGVILLLTILWRMVQRQQWRPLAATIAAGIVLDLFFLFPYAWHIANFRSTGMVVSGEGLLPFSGLPGSFGYGITCMGGLGIVLCLARKCRIDVIPVIASLALIVMFCIGEDIVPLLLSALHRTPMTFFTPSRFLTDLNYFLPIFAAIAIVHFSRHWHIAGWGVAMILLLVPLADIAQWKSMFNLYDPPQSLLDACDWIRASTPRVTLVDNRSAWTTYLCWREPAHIALPVSEPTADYHPAEDRIPQIIAGKIPPDTPNQIIVKIGDVIEAAGRPILWTNSSGAAVFREWP